MNAEADDDDDVAAVIRRTLANAVQAPHYARAFGDGWQSVRSVADFARLPLLDKATAIANQRELVVGDRPAGFGIASSGTTRTADAPVLNVLRSHDENDLLHGAGGDAVDDASDADPGWTLAVVGVHHGLPPRPPPKDELRVPWMYHKNALSMIEACIQHPQPDGRRVTAMRISAGALKTLATYLLEKYAAPAHTLAAIRERVRGFGVRMIGTNGSRLSAHWRAVVGDLFGAELYDNFSLSEIPTPATECKACNALHFGWPPLLYEVVDVATGAARERGTGKLVVTTLAPWVTKMPLVRYDTGDVVDIGADCAAAAGSPSVTYLGRLRRGVVVAPSGDGSAEGRGSFVLAPAFVQDVLEALPQTERNAHPAVTNGLVKSRELGLPRFTVERIDIDVGGPVLARLRFELRFDPLTYPEDTARIESRVRAELLKLDRQLAACVAGGRVKLETTAAAPGSLDPPGDKFE